MGSERRKTGGKRRCIKNATKSGRKDGKKKLGGGAVYVKVSFSERGELRTVKIEER